MKLKNKRTGNIIETVIVDHGADWEIRNMYTDEGIQTYDSLAELNSEWEDAPEEAIQVHIEGIQNVYMGGGRVYIDYATAKEAEKAVEKLKAWKRVKDKGSRFTGWTIDDGLRISIRSNIDKEDIYDEDKRKMKPDLDLLFGGEE